MVAAAACLFSICYGCASSPVRQEMADITPDQVLAALVSASGEGDITGVQQAVSQRSVELAARYTELAELLRASAIPRDPYEALAEALADGQPTPVSVTTNGGRSQVTVRYRQGLDASLEFVRENGAWKYDLARDIEPTVELMEQAWQRIREKYGQQQTAP